MKQHFSIFVPPELKNIIKTNKPVVALESTIISHGMPYPQNLETALKAEQIIRDNGATPATVAIINGIPTVGITESQIEYISKYPQKVKKASKRDIPIFAASEQYAATTVAATAFLASSVGIKVFATGGIGGVHRYVEDTMDISSDLEELAISDIAVICAGAKSILDIRKTLEYLETKSVTLIGYKTNEFPAFFTRKSGLEFNYRIDSSKKIAKVLKARWDLKIRGSVIIANPIPEKFDVNGDLINAAINDVCQEAKKKDATINGNLVTPYILDKINDLTNGKSLEANINLMHNNAKLASEIARELSALS